MATEAGPSPDQDALAEKRPRRERPVDPIREPLPAPVVDQWKTWLATATTTRPAWMGVTGSARPPWLIPAIAGGGVALLLLLNIGLYLAFVGGREPENSGANPAPPAVSPTVASASTPPVAADPGPLPPHPETPAVVDPGPPVPAPVAVAVEAPVEVERPMSTADVVAMYEPSVALIKGKKGSGTGFIVRAGIVATNAHVIDGEKVAELEVRFPSAAESKQGPLPARVLYKDTDRDLALLAVATDLPPVRVAKGYKFRKGEDITVIGNPGVGGQFILENAISRGILSSVTKLDSHTFYQLGIAINPGNSGGPVFDPKGRVIGVVTLKTAKREGLAFAIPADDLLTALDAAPSAIPSEPRAPDR
jgi:S1-C subfamily serine protease